MADDQIVIGRSTCHGECFASVVLGSVLRGSLAVKVFFGCHVSIFGVVDSHRNPLVFIETNAIFDQNKGFFYLLDILREIGHVGAIFGVV